MSCVTTYTTQISETETDGKTVTVVSLTPQLSADERKEIRLKIERQLYDVFCKYCPQSIENDGVLW